ncbi:MAG: C40 family peptidase [Bacteroidetes bacterium]|nr:C40 family peptidase [Bacteroidota bacterium]
MRAEPSHKSEMVNEILFGEQFTVIEKINDWHKIRLNHDNYEGWVERKDPFVESNNSHQTACYRPQIQNDIRLYPGSFTQSTSLKKEKPSLVELEQLALQYLNVPYLWGGRTLHGIDCSGFTQIIARLADVSIPRDAYQQAEFGEDVSLDQLELMDLAFFKNQKGRITHVGFVLNNSRILHASEKVRIDKLDSKGIYRDRISTYTHTLSHIKRVF